MGKSTSSSPKTKSAKANKTMAKAAKSGGAKSGGKKEEIFKYLAAQRVMGIVDVPKLDLALAVGNKNPRSEGFTKAVKELVNEGLVTSSKDGVALTNNGIGAIPKDLEVSNDPSKVRDRYIEFIQGKVKMGADKVPQVFDILADFQAHAVSDVAQQLGYSNPRSFGNTKIFAAMKEMGLVEEAGRGSYKFSDKVPRLN